MKHRNDRHRQRDTSLPPRKVIGILLWAGGITAGLFGGNYGLPVALALFVAGFFLFVSAPGGKAKR